MKNNIKRLFVLIVTVFVVFSLTACGGNNGNSVENGGNSDDKIENVESKPNNNLTNSEEKEETDKKTEEFIYYTVNFDSKGGSEIESQRIIKGNPVVRPAMPVLDGYYLNGWYRDSEATENKWNFDIDRVNSDITLYAGWTKYPTQGESGSGNNEKEDDENNSESEPQKPIYTESLVFVKEGNTYTVTGVGDESVVIIPSEYNGLPVTKIQGEYGNGAFAQKSIIEVCIPDSIVDLGQNTFNNCSDLTTVVINVTSNIATIGNNAFSGCSALTSLYLPKSVTDIGDSAFNNCGKIAFTVSSGNGKYRAENGHLIEKESGLLIRGANNSNIPSGVKIIGEASFRGTTEVKEVVLPETVTMIDKYAFQDSSLEKLYIPKSVTEIDGFIISGSNITEITYAGTKEGWDSMIKNKYWNNGKNDVKIKFAEEKPSANATESKILVAYFSCTNTTKGIAEKISEATGGDLFEIIPTQKYTFADLNYNNNNSRANKEQNDPTVRPGISNSIKNMSEYDIVFIGYPIWWGKLPKIIYTFLDTYNLSGKTVVPFCTSGSSGISTSVGEIRNEEPNADVLDGRRFNGNDSLSVIRNWINGLGLNMQKEIKTINIHCGKKVLKMDLADNPSAKEFAEKVKGGDITVTMNDYGNFEKVGSLGFYVTQSNTDITTSPGDVILYGGNSVTIYYDTNSWNFTLLGNIKNMTRESMLDFFGGEGEVVVTFSLK